MVLQMTRLHSTINNNNNNKINNIIYNCFIIFNFIFIKNNNKIIFFWLIIIITTSKKKNSFSDEKAFDELQDLAQNPHPLSVCLGADFISLVFSMHTNLKRMKLEKGKNLPKQSPIQIHTNKQMKRGREQREKDLNEKK